jgi:hypothetical protein
VKILLLFFVLYSITLNTWAKTMTNSFSDQVKMIKETSDGVKIGFELRAAFYTLKKSHPDFKKIQTQLEILQKSHKNVKIIADMSTMEIKNIIMEGP